MARGVGIAKHNAVDSGWKPPPKFGHGWAGVGSHFEGHVRDAQEDYAKLVNAGNSQRAACRVLGLNRMTVRDWLERDANFRAMIGT